MNGWLKGLYVAALASSVVACQQNNILPSKANTIEPEAKVATVSLWKKNNDTVIRRLKKYSSSKQEWHAVMAALEKNRKKNGFFAPPIDSLHYTKVQGNCFSAAVGMDLQDLTRPSPGIIAHIAIAKEQGDSVTPWAPHYKNLNDFAANLQHDGIKVEIAEEERTDYFPIIGFISDTLDWNFHFVRPFLKRDEKGDTVIAFSEKQSWIYDVRRFENIDSLEKTYNENQQYIKPTVFYVPKKYLGTELSMTD